MAELAHRVVEMRHRARAGVETGARLLRGRLRMADADDDPARREPRDPLVGDRSRRDGHHAAARRDQLSASAVLIARMNCAGCAPLRREVDERALDMHAERAWDAPRRRGPERRASTAGASVITVGSSDVVPNRRCAATIAAIVSGVGAVVEQHAAAAVDLPVDETRREHAAAEIDASRRAGRSS